MKKIILTSILLISTTKLFALSCDNPINSYDKTYCSASEMIQLDNTLNEQYQKTIMHLKSEQIKWVKKAQIQWIRERDNDCSNDGTVNVSCVNQKMKKRIETLRQIERECQASGCNQTLLSKE